MPLLVAGMVGVPMGVWLAQRYLAGFVDRVSVGGGIIMPATVACAGILLVMAAAAIRHVRQALAIRPVEALK